jgi:hypothetical protein
MTVAPQRRSTRRKMRHCSRCPLSIWRGLGLPAWRSGGNAIGVRSPGRAASCAVGITCSWDGRRRLASRGARISGLRRPGHRVTLYPCVGIRSGGSRLLGQGAGGQQEADACYKQLHSWFLCFAPPRATRDARGSAGTRILIRARSVSLRSSASRVRNRRLCSERV